MMRFKTLATVAGSVLSAIIAATVFVSPQAQAAIACPSPSNWGVYSGPPSLAPCDIGNLEFSQFGFSPGGNQPPTAAQIGVTTIGTPGNEGFNFNPAFNVVNGAITDAALRFVVTGLNGTLIDDLSIDFNGSFAGGGSTSFTETYCTISFSTGCNVFSVTNPPPNFAHHIDITPTTTLWITKDIIANSGGEGGNAAISVVENQFSNTRVPEPASLAIFGAALAGLGLIRRRRKNV